MNPQPHLRKKLIEVALPLDAINAVPGNVSDFKGLGVGANPWAEVPQ